MTPAAVPIQMYKLAGVTGDSVGLTGKRLELTV